MLCPFTGVATEVYALPYVKTICSYIGAFPFPSAGKPVEPRSVCPRGQTGALPTRVKRATRRRLSIRHVSKERPPPLACQDLTQPQPSTNEPQQTTGNTGQRLPSPDDRYKLTKPHPTRQCVSTDHAPSRVSHARPPAHASRGRGGRPGRTHARGRDLAAPLHRADRSRHPAQRRQPHGGGGEAQRRAVIALPARQCEPSLLETRAEIVEIFVDTAEAVIVAALGRGDVNAATFVLRTQGHRRGWSTLAARQEAEQTPEPTASQGRHDRRAQGAVAG